MSVPGDPGLAAVLRLVEELKEADLAQYRLRIGQRGRGSSATPSLNTGNDSSGEHVQFGLQVLYKKKLPSKIQGSTFEK